jgi:hypothetical protein
VVEGRDGAGGLVGRFAMDCGGCGGGAVEESKERGG